MAMSTETIRKITIQATQRGLPETTDALNKLSAAQDNVAASSERSAVVTDLATRRQLSAAEAYKRQTAITEDQARAIRQANDDYVRYSQTLVGHAADFLTSVAHLKLLAVAAYALSPAFRSFTNAGAAAALGQLGAAMPTVATAATRMVGVLSPALSLFTRLSIPVGAAVGAFGLLNAVWNRGTELLDKYADSQRKFFSADVEANLTKLTRFQGDDISLEQVQRATELGARLQIAKQTLSDYLKVSLDLTDPALKLQSIWIGIVETIAKGVTASSSLIDNMASIAQKAGQSSIWSKLTAGWQLPGQMTPEQGLAALQQNYGGPTATQESIDQQRARGLKLLGAAMPGGTSFGERFSGAISDLANPKQQEDVKQLSGEFERLANSIGRTTAAMEADIQTEGKSAGEVTRLRTEYRLMEAAQQDIIAHGGSLDDYAERIRKLSDRAAEAAQNLARARIASDIKFERGTIFVSDEDARIAQRLRGIYGDDIPAALHSSEAAAMRFNDVLRDIKDTSADFAKTFVNGMLQGKSASEALTGSLQSLTQKMSEKAIDSLLSLDFGKAAVQGAVGVGGTGMSKLFRNASGEDARTARVLKPPHRRPKFSSPRPQQGLSSGMDNERDQLRQAA